MVNKSPARFAEVWATLWGLPEQLKRAAEGPSGKLAIEYNAHHAGTALLLYLDDQCGDGAVCTTAIDHFADVLERVSELPTDLEFKLGDLAQLFEDTVPEARARDADAGLVAAVGRVAIAARNLERKAQR